MYICISLFVELQLTTLSQLIAKTKKNRNILLFLLIELLYREFHETILL